MGVWGGKCLKYSVGCDDTNWDLVLPGMFGHNSVGEVWLVAQYGGGLRVQGILPLFGREAVFLIGGIGTAMCSLCSSADQLKTLCHCKLAG